MINILICNNVAHPFSLGKRPILSKRHIILQTLLKEVRLNQGLSQSDLANQIQFSQSTISKYESGERRLDIIELLDLCTALHMPLSEFVSLLEERLPHHEA
jgi:transcriptional regulator with XRE-family HTH domain